MKTFEIMKKNIFTATLAIIAINSSANIGIYNCKLINSNKTATLVYYPESQSATWMPGRGLKTTQANTSGRVVNSGEILFQLFGFQDQADFLILPNGASSLPSQMGIYTYHDNDDQGEDQQNFLCAKN